MEKEKLTVNDEELIELAYSTTYRSSIHTMIQEADTERCRVILRDIMNDAGVDWERLSITRGLLTSAVPFHVEKHLQQA